MKRLAAIKDYITEQTLHKTFNPKGQLTLYFSNCCLPDEIVLAARNLGYTIHLKSEQASAWILEKQRAQTQK